MTCGLSECDRDGTTMDFWGGGGGGDVNFCSRMFTAVAIWWIVGCKFWLYVEGWSMGVGGKTCGRSGEDGERVWGGISTGGDGRLCADSERELGKRP